jgi:hypothetical protein
VLTVAIEALIHRLFKSDHDADAAFIGEVEHALQVLDSAAFKDRARKRIRGSLTSAIDVRTIDTLKRLVEQRFITIPDLKSWRELRNAAAHGEDLDGKPSLQPTLDQFHNCLQLFYKLVFVIIGYRGKYRDLSSHGWPTCLFEEGTPNVSA